MTREIYRYRFCNHVGITDVEASLLLALMAAESLHGESQVRLEASHAMDVESRTCIIDASTDVGRDLNRLFVGFLRREFGEDAFRVDRVDRVPESAPEVERTVCT